ncbi:hypothetical protein [Flavobacterium sp.]|uniref:hypothetical protein n=1 Tax=Flavobacterium sp. TaxID=239 RepID=UPI0040344B61
MAKSEAQIETEIRAIDSDCKSVIKSLENLKKEGIYDSSYIEEFIKSIKNFHADINNSDGLKVRSKNYFKAKRENDKKK